ncbi:MAG: hypothetical protein FWE99_07260, partial [Bacteroidales bacterium]|nr:hypothetical protein [Bacteroidales bacterium]
SARFFTLAADAAGNKDANRHIVSSRVIILDFFMTLYSFHYKFTILILIAYVNLNPSQKTKRSQMKNKPSQNVKDVVK